MRIVLSEINVKPSRILLNRMPASAKQYVISVEIHFICTLVMKFRIGRCMMYLTHIIIVTVMATSRSDSTPANQTVNMHTVLTSVSSHSL